LISDQRLSFCAGIDVIACFSVAPSVGASPPAASSHIWVTAVRARSASGRTRALSIRAHIDTNLAQIWVRYRSGQTRQSECIAPLRSALATCGSGPVQTRANTGGREVGPEGKVHCPPTSHIYCSLGSFLMGNSAPTCFCGEAMHRTIFIAYLEI
jgi:hypothetical protein